MNFIDWIAKQVLSMNWRKPSVHPSVCPAVNSLRLAVAFSLVSHKPLMIHKSNLVSLLTLMSSSRPIQIWWPWPWLSASVNTHWYWLYLVLFHNINHMYALLGRFVGIDGLFPAITKFCDLDLDFALQWAHTDIDFNLFSFTPLITCMPYLVDL